MSLSGDKKYLTLNNGRTMPILGVGTWRAEDEKELETALDAALEMGYRHIDCAHAYGNEQVIGRVLKQWLDSNKIKREDLFITTKLPFYGNRPSTVEKYLKESLSNLQLSYVDLYLIHTPFSVPEFKDEPAKDSNGDVIFEKDTDHVGVWKKFEEFVDQGLIKSIGISNFNERQIQRILDNSRIKPVCLQIEFHVYLQQIDLVNFCKQKNIAVVGYSPLGSPSVREVYRKSGHDRDLPNLLEVPEIQEIAKRHGKTPAQILLKWILENGVAAIPKSVHADRLRQNLDVFDFSLSQEDLDKIRELGKNHHLRVCDFSFFQGMNKHPEFPFQQ